MKEQDKLNIKLSKITNKQKYSKKEIIRILKKHLTSEYEGQIAVMPEYYKIIKELMVKQKMENIKQIQKIINKFNNKEIKLDKALDRIKDVLSDVIEFENKNLTEKAYDVIMDDLSKLQLTQTQDNIHNYNVLKHDLQDIFGIEQ